MLLYTQSHQHKRGGGGQGTTTFFSLKTLYKIGEVRLTQTKHLGSQHLKNASWLLKRGKCMKADTWVNFAQVATLVDDRQPFYSTLRKLQAASSTFFDTAPSPH